jgi:hypothetical protein
VVNQTVIVFYPIQSLSVLAIVAQIFRANSSGAGRMIIAAKKVFVGTLYFMIQTGVQTSCQTWLQPWPKLPMLSFGFPPPAGRQLRGVHHITV